MSQFRLEDREWKPFEIGKVFDLHTTKSGIDKNKIIQGDDVAYITRSEKNNGLSDFINKRQEGKYKLEKENTLTIGADTQTVFYHPYSFFTGEKVHSLRCKELNKYVSFFVITLLRVQLEKFAWGHLASIYRLTKQKIMLPINAEGHPDWKFMEAYSRCIYQQKKRELEAYQEAKSRNLFYKDIPSLDKKKWAPFELSELFPRRVRGKRLKKSDHIRGETPYISSSSTQNGVDGFIDNDEGTRRGENCLTIANSGSVGFAFFHPYNFVASDHVTQLERNGLSRYCYFFLAVCLGQIKDGFSFQREINDLRLKRQRIMLPVNNVGEPDFVYMTQYMMNIEYQNLKRST